MTRLIRIDLIRKDKIFYCKREFIESTKMAVTAGQLHMLSIERYSQREFYSKFYHT